MARKNPQKLWAGILIGGGVGLVAAIALFSAYLSFRYPNNYRDSGLPNAAVALILAGPWGLAMGAALGALIAARDGKKTK